MSLALCNHIAKKIESAGLGEIAKTIFVGAMPAESKRAILIKAPLTGIKIDHELPGYHKPRIQIIVRAQRHEDGETLANSVINTLKSDKDMIWRDSSNNPVYLMKLFLPDTLPVVYPRSEGNGLEVSINFDLCYIAL